MEKLKEKALKLGLAVYRVTKLFPEGEVLVSQIREAANQILSGLVLNRSKEARKQIEVILNYLQLGQTQNWIKPVNFDILIEEYSELMAGIKNNKEIKGEKKKAIKLTGRQKEILGHIQNLNLRSFQIGDLNVNSLKISARTLVRELSGLTDKGYLKKSGQGRGVFYSRIITPNHAKSKNNHAKSRQKNEKEGIYQIIR
ncbi:hypothetical protein KKD72_02185 [Patescibacteria group bacterium]|nr:hypothetical protein [Patescibacteria group bacterium]